MHRIIRTTLAALLLAGCATASQPAARTAPAPAASVAERPGPAAAAEEGALAPVGAYRLRSHLRLERDGRMVKTVEEEYVLRTSSPPGYFSQLSAVYDPAQDEVPTLTARVVLPDGSVKELDPATIAETPVEGSSPVNFSDRRQVVAPLPALVAGSVVHRRWTRVLSRPVVTFGQSHVLPMGTSIPVEEASVVVEHPADLPIVARTSGFEAEAVREEKDGIVRLTWTRKQAAPVHLPEELPPQARVYPEIYVSTAASWQQVARGYLGLVQPALDAAPLAGVRAQLAPASRAPRDVVAAALDWMHHHLRYTGLDFSNAGIVPHTTAQTLERGYGDCKDLAAFLVALLRAEGIDAKIALVYASEWYEGPDDVPGLGRFDHAIVHVPALDLWIDPTLRGSAPGILSDYTTDRLALVIDEATTAPTRTPVGAIEQNRAVIHTEITLPELGAGHVRTTRTLTGTALDWTRQRAIWRTAEQVQHEVAEEVERSYGGEDFTYRHSDPLSASAPFVEELEIRDARYALAGDIDAIAPLGFEAMMGMLPEALEAEDGPAIDVFVGAPAELEMVTRVRAHPLFQLRDEPVAREGSAPGVFWRYALAATPDGAEARLLLRLDRRHIAAADLAAVRATLQQLMKAENRLDFDNRIVRLLDEGQVAAAAAEIRERIAAEPKNAWLQALEARVALGAGLGKEAHRLANEAARRAPDSAAVQRTKVIVLSHGTRGEPFAAGMDRRGALEALDAATALEDGGSWASDLRVKLLARNDEGTLGGPGADVEKALEVLRGLRAEDAGNDEIYFTLLWQQAHDAELIEQKRKAEPDPLTLAAVARSQGLQAAVAWLDQHGRSKRDALVAGAVLQLYGARAYELAQGLAEQVRDPRFGPMTRMAKATRRRELTPLRLDDAHDLIVEATAISIGAEARTDAARIGLTDYAREQLQKAIGSELGKFPGGREALVDFLHGMTRVHLEEVPPIGVLAISTSEMIGERSEDLLQRTGKGLRLHPVDSPEARMREAWKAFEAGDEKMARAWLDVHLRVGARIPLLKSRTPFIRDLLGEGGDLQLALALATPEPGAHLRSILPALERHFEKRAALPRERAEELATLLLVLHVDEERFDDALAVIDILEREGIAARAESANRQRAWVLEKAKRADDLEALGRATIARTPREPFGYGLVARAAELRDDVAGYRAAWEEMLAANVNREVALNNIAWSSLHLGVTAEDVRRAELALGPSGNRPSSVDTLAVLLAEHGDVDRALHTVAQLEKSLKDGPNASALYARGRIAEALGFRTAAIELYRQVEPAKRRIDDLHHLAAKRLSRLGAK